MATIKRGDFADQSSYQKAWYAANRDRRIADGKVYREANKERIAASQATCYNNKRAAYNARNRLHRRRASKAKLPGYAADIALIYTAARALSLTVDHIWPLKGKHSCGLHVPWNLQLLTAAENDAKGNKEPNYGF